LVAAGSCTIQADQAEDVNYLAAPPVTQTFAITFGAQVIEFPAITAFTWSGGSALLAATASSGLTISYSVVSGPCHISGNTLTATTAGTCVIAADQPGNASYAPALQATVTATVGKADQTVMFTDIAEFPVSGSATLAAVASSGLAVTYQVTQ